MCSTFLRVGIGKLSASDILLAYHTMILCEGNENNAGIESKLERDSMLFLPRSLIQIASVMHTNIVTGGRRISFGSYGTLISGPCYGSAFLNHNLSTADHISYINLLWYISDRSFTAV